MGVLSPAKLGPPSGSSPSRAPNSDKIDNKHKKQNDPNMTDPRLLVNRPCIYERQLPGDAYITAHVQRLQHGYYDSPILPEIDAEHVDFLAISFVFHSVNTREHRFKSATIRVRISGGTDSTPSAARPRFLMHAPHLAFGLGTPETMDWTFSLAGALGISQTPVSASLIPSGSVSEQFQRYDMMRIQGSVRTPKSSRGPEFDAENSEILWSLEENNLQRSGLPREFTFVMLVKKPSATSNVCLTLDIKPVIDNWTGCYPGWWMRWPPYNPLPRAFVDFSREVGQPFEPADGERGFNFGTLVSTLDDYVVMPGRKFSRSMPIPQPSQFPPASNLQQGYPGQYGLNAMPQLPGKGQGNALLEWQLRQMRAQGQGVTPAAPPAPGTTGMVCPVGWPTASAGSYNNTINVRLGLDPAMASQLPRMPVSSPFSPFSPFNARGRSRDLRRESRWSEIGVAGSGLGSGLGWYGLEDSRAPIADAVESWLDGVFAAMSDPRPAPDLGSGDQSYESVRARMLSAVHPDNREERVAPVQRVMTLENRPLTPEMLAALPEKDESSEESEEE